MFERDPAGPDRHRPLTPLVDLGLSWRRISRSRGDFLIRQRPSDLNGRNLSALYEIVHSRRRNPQVLCRLFYSNQIVKWSFAHNFRSNLNHCRYFSYYRKPFYPTNFMWVKKYVERSSSSRCLLLLTLSFGEETSEKLKSAYIESCRVRKGGGSPQPRLLPPWHRVTLQRQRRGHRTSDRQMPQPSSRRGVPQIHESGG